MKKSKKNYLKLIVDNTAQGKIRSLLTNQKKLIKEKLKCQDQKWKKLYLKGWLIKRKIN